MSPEASVRVVLMGPAGSGKTLLGRRLSTQLCAKFVDGDSLHTAENIEKMRRGEPVSDDDRSPWLDRIARLLHSHAEAGKSVVVACSALASRIAEHPNVMPCAAGVEVRAR